MDKEQAERVEKIRQRHTKATPGPYKWEVHTEVKSVRLVSDAPMRPIVLSFWRWGMNKAAPVFRDAVHDILRRAEVFFKPFPDREKFGTIDHPDAIALEHSWQDVHDLLSALDVAEAKASKYRDKLEEFRLYAHDPEIRNEARDALKEEE